MKLTIKAILSLTLVMLITSCEKDTDKYKFSELTVEENKEVVEDAAIQAAQAMEGMSDLDIIETSIQLGTCLDQADPLAAQDAKKSKVHVLVNGIAGLESDKDGIAGLLSAMKYASDDPETIQEAWDMVVGTYEWNSTTEDWDYTANADAIVFKFPATETSTTNNAVLTVSNYTGVTIANPIDEEYDGDLPATLDIELAVDGTVLMDYSFAVEYNDDGIPSSVETTLNIYPYSFEVSLTNNDEEASGSSTISKDGDQIAKVSAGIYGDFSESNIEANTTEDEWGYEEVDVGGIISNGEFSIELFNIALKGTGDIAALADSIEMIYPDDYWDDPDYDEEDATEREASAINNTVYIYAADTDAKKKIAEVEAYVVEDTWGSGEYSYTDYWVDFRLIFGEDVSPVDLETYFEDGFDDLIDELNDMISDINSEHGLDLDPIDY